MGRYLVSCPAQILPPRVGTGLLPTFWGQVFSSVPVWNSILNFILTVCPTLVFLKELEHFMYLPSLQKCLRHFSSIVCLSVYDGTLLVGPFCFMSHLLPGSWYSFMAPTYCLRTSYPTLLLDAPVTHFLDTSTSQQISETLTIPMLLSFWKFYFLLILISHSIVSVIYAESIRNTKRKMTIRASLLFWPKCK